MTRRKICTQRLYGCVDHVECGVWGLLSTTVQCYVKHVETGLLPRTETTESSYTRRVTPLDYCCVLCVPSVHIVTFCLVGGHYHFVHVARPRVVT